MTSKDNSDFLQELWHKYVNSRYKDKPTNLLAFLRSLYFKSMKQRHRSDSFYFTNDISGMVTILIRQFLNDLENLCLEEEEEEVQEVQQESQSTEKRRHSSTSRNSDKIVGMTDEEVSNDVRNLKIYLQSEHGALLLYGIEFIVEQLLIQASNNKPLINSIFKLSNNSSSSNISTGSIGTTASFPMNTGSGGLGFINLTLETLRKSTLKIVIESELGNILATTLLSILTGLVSKTVRIKHTEEDLHNDQPLIFSDAGLTEFLCSQLNRADYKHYTERRKRYSRHRAADNVYSSTESSSEEKTEDKTPTRRRNHQNSSKKNANSSVSDCSKNRHSRTNDKVFKFDPISQTELGEVDQSDGNTTNEDVAMSSYGASSDFNTASAITGQSLGGNSTVKFPIVNSLRSVSRLLGHVSIIDLSTSSDVISVHLELVKSATELLQHMIQQNQSLLIQQLYMKLIDDLLRNLIQSVTLMLTRSSDQYKISQLYSSTFSPNSNLSPSASINNNKTKNPDQDNIDVLIGYKVIDRLLQLCQQVKSQSQMPLSLLLDLNKVVMFILIVVAHRCSSQVDNINNNNNTTAGSRIGLIHLISCWYIADGHNLTQWALNNEIESEQASACLFRPSRVSLFSLICDLLNVINRNFFGYCKDQDIVIRNVHHIDLLNIITPLRSKQDANKSRNTDTCCYAVLCQLLFNTLLNQLKLDSHNKSRQPLSQYRRKIYHRIMSALRPLALCCTVDLFSYCTQLLSLLLNKNSVGVKNILLRYLQSIIEHSFELYRHQSDECQCHFSSRHDTSLILKEIRNVCLPRNFAPNQSVKYSTNPVDLLHFIDWLAKSRDSQMKQLVTENVAHPILHRLLEYSDQANDETTKELSLQYQLIGTCVLSLLPYLNSNWEEEDLELIGAVCNRHTVLQSTFYKCLTTVLLSKQSPASTLVEYNTDIIWDEFGIKTRIINHLLTSNGGLEFNNIIRALDHPEYRLDKFVSVLLEDVHIWQCYRLLFSYSDLFRQRIFDNNSASSSSSSITTTATNNSATTCIIKSPGSSASLVTSSTTITSTAPLQIIECCYIVLKQTVQYICQQSYQQSTNQTTDQYNMEYNNRAFLLFESLLCLVVDGNIIKSTDYYEGYSCELIWIQLKALIISLFPSNHNIAKRLFLSFYNCCFRVRWTVQDGLHQLRELFLDSINAVNSCIKQSKESSDDQHYHRHHRLNHSKSNNDSDDSVDSAVISSSSSSSSSSSTSNSTTSNSSRSISSSSQVTTIRANSNRPISTAVNTSNPNTSATSYSSSALRDRTYIHYEADASSDHTIGDNRIDSDIRPVNTKDILQTSIQRAPVFVSLDSYGNTGNHLDINPVLVEIFVSILLNMPLDLHKDLRQETFESIYAIYRTLPNHHQQPFSNDQFLDQFKSQIEQILIEPDNSKLQTVLLKLFLLPNSSCITGQRLNFIMGISLKNKSLTETILQILVEKSQLCQPFYPNHSVVMPIISNSNSPKSHGNKSRDHENNSTDDKLDYVLEHKLVEGRWKTFDHHCDNSVVNHNSGLGNKKPFAIRLDNNNNNNSSSGNIINNDSFTTNNNDCQANNSSLATTTTHPGLSLSLWIQMDGRNIKTNNINNSKHGNPTNNSSSNNKETTTIKKPKKKITKKSTTRESMYPAYSTKSATNSTMYEAKQFTKRTTTDDFLHIVSFYSKDKVNQLQLQCLQLWCRPSSGSLLLRLFQRVERLSAFNFNDDNLSHHTSNTSASKSKTKSHQLTSSVTNPHSNNSSKVGFKFINNLFTSSTSSGLGSASTTAPSNQSRGSTTSSTNGKSSSITEPFVIIEPNSLSSFNLVGESTAQNFIYSNGWNFLTITVEWMPLNLAHVTWLLNNDSSYESKLYRSPLRLFRSGSYSSYPSFNSSMKVSTEVNSTATNITPANNTSNNLESYISIGHITMNSDNLSRYQRYALGNIFIFENPVIRSVKDNLNLMLLAYNWDGELSLNERSRGETCNLASVVLQMLVDAQATTDSAAQLMEAGQNLLNSMNSDEWMSEGHFGYLIQRNLLASFVINDQSVQMFANTNYHGDTHICLPKPTDTTNNSTASSVLAEGYKSTRTSHSSINIIKSLITKCTIDSAFEKLGGINTLIFWMAKLTDEQNDAGINLIIQLYLTLLRKSILLALQNNQIHGYSIILQLFKSFKFPITVDIINYLIEHSLYESSVKPRVHLTVVSPKKLCRDPYIVHELMLQWKIWQCAKQLEQNHQHPINELNLATDTHLLDYVNKLLTETNIHSSINCDWLNQHGVLNDLLNACYEPFDVLQRPLPIELCQMIIKLIGNVLPTPVDLPTITKLCNTILQLYPVSMKEENEDKYQNNYFRLLKVFVSDPESNNLNGPKISQTSSSILNNSTISESKKSLLLSTSSIERQKLVDLTDLELSKVSAAEIKAMQQFYDATKYILNDDATEEITSEEPVKLTEELMNEENLETSISEEILLASNSSADTITDNIIFDKNKDLSKSSFIAPTIMSTETDTQFTSDIDCENRSNNRLICNHDNCSRVTILSGLISILENIIQVKISDSVLEKFSIDNFCLEFILHLISHPSSLVRQQSLSLFRVYLYLNKSNTNNVINHPLIINVVGHVVSKNICNKQISAEILSIIFSQNIAFDVLEVNWEEIEPNQKVLQPVLEFDNYEETVDDALYRIYGLISKPKSKKSDEDSINSLTNPYGFPLSRISVLLVSILDNIEDVSLLWILNLFNWLFVNNSILIHTCIKSGLCEVVANLCYRFTKDNITIGTNSAFESFKSLCKIISIEITIHESTIHYMNWLEMCELIGLSVRDALKKNSNQDFKIEQEILGTIFSSIIDTITQLNDDSAFKIEPSEIIKSNLDLERNIGKNDRIYSNKLIKIINVAQSLIINVPNPFDSNLTLFMDLGLFLLEFTAELISKSLSCIEMPDQFSMYLYSKEFIKKQVGELIIFMTQPNIVLSMRIKVLHSIFKFKNFDRIIRYSLLGNSSGAVCLIINLRSALEQIQLGDYPNELKEDCNRLFQVVSMDFELHDLDDDSSKLWLQDTLDKRDEWQSKKRELLNQWQLKNERNFTELMVVLKHYQNNYRPYARKNLQTFYNNSLKDRKANEFIRRRSWKTIIRSFTQERSIGQDLVHQNYIYQLDPVEGPARIRRRMIKTPRNLKRKFFKNSTNENVSTDSSYIPLQFLFDATYQEDRMVFENPIECQLLKCIEDVRISCSCIWVGQSGTFEGEFFLSRNRLGFMIDSSNSCQYTIYDQLPSVLRDFGFISWRLSEIEWIVKRRFKLRDLAFEIFMKDGRNCMIAVSNSHERDTIINNIDSFMPSLGFRSKPRLNDWQQKWLAGDLTNFEYLMRLNTCAGRSYNDIMQYPVFPFILTNYEKSTLDLRDERSFRDLSKPISVQYKQQQDKVAYSFQEKVEEYERQLQVIRQSNDFEDLSVWAVPPHHYSSLYSNSVTVLYYLIRVPPFTHKFIEFQDNEFDRADRLFHTVQSAWDLSTKSLSCVKELIPEFFYLPEMFINSQQFNFGVRQNGEVVDDILLPQWCNGDARLFCLIHRVAMESPFVTSKLNQWIDLIFGYKQTGKAALDSFNLFHPYTYFKAIRPDEINDSIRRRAVEQMIENYGQIPKQLFHSRQHPHRKVNTQALRKSFSQRIALSDSANITSSSNRQFNASDNSPVHSEVNQVHKSSSSSSVINTDISPTSLSSPGSSVSVLNNIFGISWGDWVGSPDNHSTFVEDIPSRCEANFGRLMIMPVQLTSGKKSIKQIIIPHLAAIVVMQPNDEAAVHVVKLQMNQLCQRVYVSLLQINSSTELIQQSNNIDNFQVSFVLSSSQSRVTSIAIYQRSGRVFLGLDSGLIQVCQLDLACFVKNTVTMNFMETITKVWCCMSASPDGNSAIVRLAVSESFSILVAANQQAYITVWDAQRYNLLFHIDSTSHPINDWTISEFNVASIEISETLGDLAIARVARTKIKQLTQNHTTPVVGVSGQQTSLVSLYSINGRHIHSVKIPGTIVDMSATNLPEGRNINALAIVTQEGRLFVLSSWTMQTVWRVRFTQNISGSGSDKVVSVQYSRNARELYVLHQSGSLHVFCANKHDSNLRQFIHFWQ